MEFKTKGTKEMPGVGFGGNEQYITDLMIPIINDRAIVNDGI